MIFQIFCIFLDCVFMICRYAQYRYIEVSNTILKFWLTIKTTSKCINCLKFSFLNIFLRASSVVLYFELEYVLPSVGGTLACSRARRYNLRWDAKSSTSLWEKKGIQSTSFVLQSSHRNTNSMLQHFIPVCSNEKVSFSLKKTRLHF